MNNNLIMNEITSEFADEIVCGINCENNNEFSTNCLALTIRKDYRFTVVSNIANTAKRISLKVLANIGMLNFLTMIF